MLATIYKYMMGLKTPHYFASQEEFRDWLSKNGTTETELILGYYKVGSGKTSMSWSESVDQALCFGWIDGLRRSVDAESYCIRFTPRRKNSIWSEINIKKVEELTKARQMTPAGLEAFSFRQTDKSGIYSHESRVQTFSEPFLRLLKANSGAWDFFTKQAPSYQRAITHWIMSAKQEKTRLARLQKLIESSEQGHKIY